MIHIFDTILACTALIGWYMVASRQPDNALWLVPVLILAIVLVVELLKIDK